VLVSVAAGAGNAGGDPSMELAVVLGRPFPAEWDWEEVVLKALGIHSLKQQKAKGLLELAELAAHPDCAAVIETDY